MKKTNSKKSVVAPSEEYDMSFTVVFPEEYAKTTRAVYLSLLKEGFSSEQAMALTIEAARSMGK